MSFESIQRRRRKLLQSRRLSLWDRIIVEYYHILIVMRVKQGRDRLGGFDLGKAETSTSGHRIGAA